MGSIRAMPSLMHAVEAVKASRRFSSGPEPQPQGFQDGVL